MALQQHAASLSSHADALPSVVARYDALDASKKDMQARYDVEIETVTAELAERATTEKALLARIDDHRKQSVEITNRYEARLRQLDERVLAMTEREKKVRSGVACGCRYCGCCLW